MLPVFLNDNFLSIFLLHTYKGKGKRKPKKPVESQKKGGILNFFAWNRNGDFSSVFFASYLLSFQNIFK